MLTPIKPPYATLRDVAFLVVFLAMPLLDWTVVLGNIFPMINFVILVLLIIQQQYVRHELEKRSLRFERIEHELARLENAIQPTTEPPHG